MDSLETSRLYSLVEEKVSDEEKQRLVYDEHWGHAF